MQQCKSALLFGPACTNKAEGIVVPTGAEPLAIYNDGLVLCPPCARHVLKADTGARWLSLEYVQSMQAALARQQSVTETVKEVPMSASAVAETETTDTFVIDIAPPTVPAVPAPIPVHINGHANGHAAPVQEATPVLVTPPAPVSPVDEAAALRAAAEQLKASYAAQASALQAQLAAIKEAERQAEQAARDAERKVQEAARLARLAAWDLPKLRALVAQGGTVALTALDDAMTVGFVTVAVKKAPKAPTAASTTPATASTPRPASTGKQTYSDDIVARVKALKAQGLSDKAIELELGIGKGDGKAAWALRSDRRKAA